MNQEQFDKARREFDQLRAEDKAIFLLEATVSTIARGVEQFGQVVVDEIDRAFRKKREAEAESTSSTSESSSYTHGTAPETPPM
ncbi:MAG TPA: hypothetical protein VF190_04440 [Rhodothermales bacterium]